ncbi:MAG TPA: co-chaperone DjlA [Gammaproteobacteria bacterium]
MPLIVIAALLGLILGGVRGLVIAVVLTYLLSFALRQGVRRAVGLEEEEFLDATFAVMGALAKADSVVTKDEIRAAEAVFDRLGLSAAQREAAKAAFRRGKAPTFDLDAEVARLRAASRGRVGLLRLFLHIQYMAVAADGRVHPAEHAMLLRVARGLGLSEFDLAQLEAMLRAAGAWGGGAHGAGRRTGSGAGAQTGAAPTGRSLEDAYAALGVSPQASDAELRRAYRKLMNQNHPDKLAGRGLPESMRALAEERTREISAAYRLIKESRERARGARA